MNVREALDNIYKEFEKSYEEAKKEGYNAGLEDGNISGGTLDEKIKEAYENGANDAWECTRKIACTPEKGGYTWSVLEQIFNTRSLSNIINTYTASEAISKIKEYEEEQKKAAEIKIGDEVHTIYDDTPMVVVSIFNEDVTDEKRVVSVSISGIISTLYVDELEKTGRHFPEIAEVLKQMQEGSE